MTGMDLSARPLVVAIDGPAASGKGTLGRRIAAHFGLPHLDTGLLYRGTARAMLDAGYRLDDVESATAMASALDVARLDEERLRGAQMGEAASIVAAIPQVRAALLDQQRRFAAQAGGAVLDGRDIGTVICPHATAKLFITASAACRAERRHRELVARDGPSAPDMGTVLGDIERRDARDSGRGHAELRIAEDAVVIDTTELTIDSAVALALAAIERRWQG